jgi:excinuclease ABC subunit A
VHSPAAFLNLTPPLRALFAESEEAQALGISEQQLATRCSACGGSGLLTLDMAFLPDVHVPCETCRGTGYLPEAWEVRLRGLALPEVYDLTIDQVFALFGDVEQLARPLQAARDVGLGYLVLRQPGYSLSGGEAQRLRIAQELCRPPAGRGKSQGRSGQAAGPLADTLYILDEPSVGQHLEDVLRLTGVLHRLVDEGGSVFVVEHHPHLLAACDWLLELGPAGGPQGGYVIASGTPEAVAAGNTPSAPYLREVLGL